MFTDVIVPSLQPMHEARGADYAAALEMPTASRVSDAVITIVMVIGAVLGAAVMILLQA